MEEKFITLANEESLNKTIQGLTAKGYFPSVVDNKDQALAKIKGLIPAGASVMNGTSATLQQVGYIDYLKEGKHGWDNLHERILNEKDPEKQSLLRRHSLASDFYLGSVHALTETGEMVFGSNSGSQIPNIAYGSTNLIFVVGTHKITKDLDAALDRLRNYVVGLENARMQKAKGSGTNLSKLLVLFADPAFLERKINIILVKEALGF
ncbi:MAG: lactate utilization protein [Candidatus Doudnabacteria bacterium]|nr:lactate utilization protein [Candidatus Doudnabacteria bacterium]